MARRKANKGVALGIEHDGPLATGEDSAIKPKTGPLPWPRSDEDGTPLGVDIGANYKAIDRIARGYFNMPSTRRFMAVRSAEGRCVNEVCEDDFSQEVLLTIVRRNHFPGAFDPRRAQLATYVWNVARTTLEHKTHRLVVRVVTDLDGHDHEDCVDGKLDRMEHQILSELGQLDTEDDIISVLDDEER